MFYKSLLSVLVILFAAANIFAQDTPSISVDEMKFCTAVEDRQPAGVDTSFAATVERVYCYTVISTPDTAVVSQMWFHGDKEMAKIDLNVKPSKTWRTWSSKRIVPEWTGDWRVDVVTASGAVLKSMKFTVK